MPFTGVGAGSWCAIFVKVKIFNVMNFVSIPENGSSWQGSLIYSFACEESVPADLVVEIRDVNLDELIGIKRFYGVTAADIDIAPYVRLCSEMRISLERDSGIFDTCLSRSIVVSINGVASEVRCFVPQALDLTAAKFLTPVAEESSVDMGDVVLFTLYAPMGLRVATTIYTPNGRRQLQLTWSGRQSIVDVALVVEKLSISTRYFVVEIFSGSELIKTLKFNVVDSNAQARKLLWRNRQGGIERYLFPHSIRLACGAVVDSVTTSAKVFSKLRSTLLRSRLCSALETQEELERIAHIVESPYIYEYLPGELHDLELESRTIDYSPHGKLRYLTLDIVERRKGGEL